jgi:hypothetical protein
MDEHQEPGNSEFIVKTDSWNCYCKMGTDSLESINNENQKRFILPVLIRNDK